MKLRRSGWLGMLSASLMLVGLTAGTDAGAAVSRLDEFIGSRVCMACHNDYKGWLQTAHNQILRGGNQEMYFINDGSGTGRPDFYDGIEYNLCDLPGGEAFIELDPTCAEAPRLGSDPVNGPYIKIGDVTYDVNMTVGGSAVQSAAVADTDLNGVHNGEAQWRQLYLGIIGVSRYVLPVQFNAKTGEYALYHPEDWYDAAGLALPIDRTTIDRNLAYERRCAGCHSTGVNVARSTTGKYAGEWSMSYTDATVACESCHGPGRAHVEASDAQKKSKIVNPATLTTTLDLNGDTLVDSVDNLIVENYVCYQCHQKGTGTYSALATPETTLLYPSIAGANAKPALYRPGLDLTPYFDVSQDANDYWGLGFPAAGEFLAAASSQMQGVEHAAGPHAADQSYDHPCFACHDMHNTDRVHLLVSENEGVPVPQPDDRTNQRNNLCLSCHVTHGDFVDLTADDLIAGSDNVVTVVRAHVKNRAYMDVTFQTRCISCHLPFTGKSALEGDLASHVFEPIWPGFVMQPGDFQWTEFLPWWESNESFTDPLDGTAPHATVGRMPDSCLGCHNPAEDNDIVTQWTTSGHGDGFAEPWNHWNADASISSSCARCHSAYGYRQLADSSTSTDPLKPTPPGVPWYTLDANSINPSYPTVTSQSPIYPRVLNCEGCHEPNGGGLTLYQAGKLQEVAFPSGVRKTLGNSSNVCMQCHQGRQSGKSIPSCSTTTGYCSVPSEHYLPEAATFFGTEVTAGYEYAAKTYAGKVPFAGHEQIEKQDCISCHINKRNGSTGATTKDHNFVPELTDCNYCHWDANYADITDFEDLALPFGSPNVDYDGDGVGESFRAEMDGLMDILVRALNIYAKAAGRPPLIFVPGQTSLSEVTNGCYIQDGCVPVTADPPVRYAFYDLRMVKAAYNWNAARDRAAAIHNHKYVIQTVYDSIEDMDPASAVGLTRP
jgi:hypothetical protein